VDGIFAFHLHDRDSRLPNKLTKLVDYLDEYRNCNGVCTNMFGWVESFSYLKVREMP